MSISIALTKGRIEKEVIKILEKSNFGIDELKNKGRKLVFNDTKEDIKYFLVKANDTVTYVEHGVADIAIVGKDTLLEREEDYYEVLDLGLGKCKFIVAALPDYKKLNNGGQIKIEGSVELAPILGISNAIVDIMETGTTLKENGLIVLAEICDISTRVIINKSSFKLKSNEINRFLNKIRRCIK